MISEIIESGIDWLLKVAKPLETMTLKYWYIAALIPIAIIVYLIMNSFGIKIGG